MILIDFLILIPILYACYRGFVNGMIREVLGMVGIVLGVFLTFRYMEALAGVIEPLFSGYETFTPFIAGALIFIGTLILIQLAAWGATQLMVAVKLNPLNRVAGVLFGILKSSIIISAILMILAGFGLPDRETRDDSLLYGAVAPVAPWAYNAVAAIWPGAEYFAETFQQSLDRQSDPNLPSQN